jgi:hypothetical protein
MGAMIPLARVLRPECGGAFGAPRVRILWAAGLGVFATVVFWDARRQTASGLGERLSERLLQGGFAIDRVLVKKLKPVPAVCVIGRA